MMEARNLRNMTILSTPLMGQENTPLHTVNGVGTGFESATPRHQVSFTPNPLATPLRNEADALSTPQALSHTPLRTPLRDNLAINVGGQDDTSAARVTAQRTLKASFRNLPKPENNFELIVPENDMELEGAEGSNIREEDATERDARLEQLKQQEEQRLLARRSLVVQRGLPRPAIVDTVALLQRLDINDGRHNAIDDHAWHLICTEMAYIVHHDSIAHPLPGTDKPGAVPSTYEFPSDYDVGKAKDAIHAELASMVGFPATAPDQLRHGLYSLIKSEALDESISWATLRRQLLYSVAAQAWVIPESLSPQQRATDYDYLLRDKRESMVKDASKAAKAEKKLDVMLGGYQARSQSLYKRITDAFDEHRDLKVNHESFSRLRHQEDISGPRRVASLKEEVDLLESRERLLQARYAELEVDRNDVEARITSLEEKLMAQAEALNQAHLAELDGK